MGFLDSLFKSTVRRVVNDVVDKTVDATLGKVLDQNTNNTNVHNNTVQTNTVQQPIQNRTATISKPALSGVPYNDILLTIIGCNEVAVSFEKAEKLYAVHSGAAEVPINFVIADSEQEAYFCDDAQALPQIYLGTDDLVQGQPWMKNVSNMIVSDVVGHSVIKKKYAYEYHSKADAYSKEINCRCRTYKFFLSPEDEQQGKYTVLTLRVPMSCDEKTYSYADKAVDLIAATIKLG